MKWKQLLSEIKLWLKWRHRWRTHFQLECIESSADIQTSFDGGRRMWGVQVLLRNVSMATKHSANWKEGSGDIQQARLLLMTSTITGCCDLHWITGCCDLHWISRNFIYSALKCNNRFQIILWSFLLFSKSCCCFFVCFQAVSMHFR